MYPQHPCLICGTLTTNRLVCSKKCIGKLRSQRATIRCPVCDTPFKPQRNRSNHSSIQCCSKKCAGILRQRRKSSACLMCGCEITEKVSRSRTFCSKRCQDSWLPSHRPIHTCKNCGKQFTTTRGHKQKPIYCSRICRDAYRKEKAAKFTCLQCHEKFINYCGNKSPRFCSRACFNLYNGPTSIEAAISVILSDMSIEAVPQYQLSEFVFDFLIPSARLFVECDGTYWHSFPEAKHRDRVKDELANKNGFRVLRLPETLIDKHPDQCRDLIVKELG